jgi:hypothetical protein
MALRAVTFIRGVGFMIDSEVRDYSRSCDNLSVDLVLPTPRVQPGTMRCCFKLRHENTSCNDQKSAFTAYRLKFPSVE